jgi:hypothetical protein
MPKFKEFYQSFIKETPDSTIDSAGNIVDYDDVGETYTFLIDKKTGESIWAKTIQDGLSVTHNNLYSWVSFSNTHEDYEEFGIEVISHLGKDSTERLKMNGAGSSRTADGTFIGGRIFKSSNVISFWNTEVTVKEHSKIIKDFIENDMKMNSDEINYDLIDIGGNKTASTLFGTQDVDEDRLSPEEIKRLMEIQHIDPLAKKKLRQNAVLDDEGTPRMRDWRHNLMRRLSDSVEHNTTTKLV